MAFGKTEEQKRADAAAKAAARQQAAQAKAAAEYAASPRGMAEAAFQSGAAFYQLELDISRLSGAASGFGSSVNNIQGAGGRPDILGQVEEVGWRLENVGYVFVETGSTTSNRMMSTGQGTVTKGVVRGIYLFRRVA